MGWLWQVVAVASVGWLFQAVLVKGHGRMMNPPSRASMWRYGFPTPPNYSDNQMFCGGFQFQKQNDGKCGICGDPFDGPFDHEAGGKYATGKIVRNYNMSDVIDVRIQLTANHKGFVQFKICPNNDVTKRATHACLDQYVLADESGNTEFMITGSLTGFYDYRVVLPEGLTCSQCVLQWRYHAGNSWGTDPDGTACVGCGPQEEFYACADVQIGEAMTQVTDPMVDPEIPTGNDPSMTDYEDWDWDTTPGGGDDVDDDGGAASSIGYMLSTLVCCLVATSIGLL